MNKVEVLKYHVIRNPAQYTQYCEMLQSLLEEKNQSIQIEEEIDLLTALIEKYDDEHTSFSALDPVQVLCSFMAEHNMTASDLSKKLDVGKSYISEILNYKKSFSKDIIRQLARLFKVRQEIFNKEYPLSPKKYTITRKKNRASKKTGSVSLRKKVTNRSAQKRKGTLVSKRSKQKARVRVKS